MMKILIVTNLYPNPVEPTRGVFTFQLLEQLKKKHHIDVLVPIPWFPRWKILQRFSGWYNRSSIPSFYNWKGNTVSTVRYFLVPKISGPFHALLMLPSLYWKISYLQRRNHYDCINVRWVYPEGVAVVVAAKNLGIPVAITAQGCDINRYSYLLARRPQIGAALRMSNLVLTVSNSLKKRVIELGVPNEKVAVVPNGVDLELFKPRSQVELREKLEMEPDTRYILFVGSLEEVKGIGTLLEAIRIMKKNGRNDFKLLMAGSGSFWERIQNFIERHNLHETVMLLGSVPHKKIADFMGACDVFCLPSIREGHPNVVNEALASGKPVVGTNVGAIPDLITRETGIIVNPNDAVSLAKGLCASLDHKWDTLKIRNHVANCSWGECGQNYSNALEQMVNKLISK